MISANSGYTFLCGDEKIILPKEDERRAGGFVRKTAAFDDKAAGFYIMAMNEFELLVTEDAGRKQLWEKVRAVIRDLPEGKI